MAYHPLYDGLWHHEDLEGAPFEEKAFFIFLWSNERIRPSGIYRVSTAQLAADTELPEKRVVAYLADLHTRRRIVRDGGWLFIRGYLSRQPNQPRLMLGVERDVKSCSSVAILTAFGEKYPLHKKWSSDRLLTITDTSHELARPEQLQSIEATEHRNADTEHADGQETVAPRDPWPSPAALVELYNQAAPNECPEVTKLSPGRRKKAAEYLAAFPDRTFWEETCAQIRASRFLRGLRSSPGHEKFVADFDWLLTKGKDGSENCVKVYEGKYHD